MATQSLWNPITNKVDVTQVPDSPVYGQPFGTPGSTSTIPSTIVAPAAPQIGQSPAPSATPNVSSMFSPVAAKNFQEVISTAIQHLNDNNEFVKQKNLLVKHLYDAPLTPQEIATLPKPLQQSIAGGDRNDIEFQIRMLNDNIAGRSQGINTSLGYLSQGYATQMAAAEKQKDDAITNILNYAKSLNQKPSVIAKAIYPDIAAELGSSLDTLAAPLLTSTQILPTTGSFPSWALVPGGAAYINNVSGLKDPTTGQFQPFATPQDSFDATVKDIQGKQTGDTSTGLNGKSTLADFVNTWIGGTGRYSAQDIAGYLGVPVDTKIGNIDANDLARAVSNFETGYSGQNVVDASQPDSKMGNVIDPVTGITPNAIWQDAIRNIFEGTSVQSFVGGMSNTGQAKAAKQAIGNKAAAIVTAMGSSYPALQALYKANSAAATQNVERLARVESVTKALSLNFPRLEQLADQVKASGIEFTESDLQATQSEIARKFGSGPAASYLELIKTMQSDYGSIQSALAGSRGGQFFAQLGPEAIPLGLTSSQYENINKTLQLSSDNAKQAINSEVQDLIGVSGGIGGPSTSNAGSTVGGPAGTTNTPDSAGTFDSLFSQYGG